MAGVVQEGAMHFEEEELVKAVLEEALRLGQMAEAVKAKID
jgi:hypothetical protein